MTEPDNEEVRACRANLEAALQAYVDASDKQDGNAQSIVTEYYLVACASMFEEPAVSSYVHIRSFTDMHRHLGLIEVARLKMVELWNR